MDDFKPASDLDSGLIDEIVCKVKSEGLFDQFRRECLADVDTKPAYQNLQHRVESSVSLFLDGQKWDSQTNKNHLRERLRKLITEKSFFEAGIGRIVDQVVNPKLNTNFVPKIEDVAYKLLGVEKPSMNMKLKLEIETDVLLPIYELEQVSPESEKSQSDEPKYSTQILQSIPVKYQIHEDIDVKNEDLESPAFEPIEPTSENKSYLESEEMNDDDMDISDDDADADADEDGKINGFTSSHIDEVKSNLSSISGLTSNESNNSSYSNLKETSENNVAGTKNDNIDICRIIATENHMAPEITIDSAEKLPFSENIISNTSELIIDNMNQDSVLSQVSSTSRLSIVTNNNTNTRTGDGEFESSHTAATCYGSSKITPQSICPYGISEEAQMQKFNENSSSSNGLVIDTDNMYVSTCNLEKQNLITSFDIKREEIKFEKTDRKFHDVNTDQIFAKKMENDINVGEKNVFVHHINTENAIHIQKPDSDESLNLKCKLEVTRKQILHTDRSDCTNLQIDGDHLSSMRCSANDMEYNYMEENNSRDSYKKNVKRISSRKFMEGEPVSPVSGDNWNDNNQNVSFSTSSQKKKNSNRERSSKKDDHSTHKGKITSRQRSRSKDSNDGFTHSNIQSSSNHYINDQSTSNNQTSNRTSEHVTSHSTSEHTTDELNRSVYSLNANEYQQSKQEIIPSSQPVVIDQILTGNELDLTSFIGENRDDPVLSSIKQSLETKMKKPKMAENMFEAKKLMKIRKQIELSNQKKLEKATVLAKQYIRTNASNMLDDTQGIELEFVCVENRKGGNMSGPIISSPISKKIIDTGSLVPTPSQTAALTTLKKTEEIYSLSKKARYVDDVDSEKLNFIGFESSEVKSAEITHRTFLDIVNSYSTMIRETFSKLTDVKLYNSSENNIASNEVNISAPCKPDGNMINSQSSSVSDEGVIMGNAFVSKSEKCNTKQVSSPHIDDISSKNTIEKQRHKTRYSNDDLFKPRPLLGGISRRRRGFNSNE